MTMMIDDDDDVGINHRVACYTRGFDGVSH